MAVKIVKDVSGIVSKINFAFKINNGDSSFAVSVRSDPFSPFKVSGCRFLLPQSLCVIDCSVERVILDSNSPLKNK